MDELPDVLEEALARIIAGERKEWAKERERIEAESRATIAAFRAEITELKMLHMELRNGADAEIGRLRDALALVKDGAPGEQGAPGKDADPEEIVGLVLARMPPPEKGEPGQPGEPGRDGRDIDPQVIDATIAAHVVKAITELPPPPAGPPGADGADGVDGRDADPDAIAAMVLERIPMPKDGADGLPGPQGEPGPPGKGIDPEEVVSLVLERLPPPEKGEKGDPGADGRDGRDGVGVAGAFLDREGHGVLTLSDGTVRDLGIIVGKDGRDGADGAPGAPGRDGKDGLSFDDFVFEPEYDGERTLRLRWSDAKGNEQTREWRLPVMIYKEIWKPDANYEAGDAVRFGGSLWLAVKQTPEKPGDGCADWRLVARAGRDGRDGAPGAKGERGPAGPPGPERLVTGGS